MNLLNDLPLLHHLSNYYWILSFEFLIIIVIHQLFCERKSFLRKGIFVFVFVFSVVVRDWRRRTLLLKINALNNCRMVIQSHTHKKENQLNRHLLVERKSIEIFKFND
jgi:hypothetical protein